MGSFYKSVCIGIVLLSCTLYASDPNILVDPNVLSFTASEAGTNPNDQLLTVGNSGGGILNWLITDVNEVPFSPPAWLTIAPTTGSLANGQSEPVTLSVDTTGLSDGHYSYVFEVADPAATNSTQAISVTLSIGGAIYLNGINYPEASREFQCDLAHFIRKIDRLLIDNKFFEGESHTVFS